VACESQWPISLRQLLNKKIEQLDTHSPPAATRSVLPARRPWQCSVGVLGVRGNDPVYEGILFSLEEGVVAMVLWPLRGEGGAGARLTGIDKRQSEKCLVWVKAGLW
jgi:hypothetical protein